MSKFAQQFLQRRVRQPSLWFAPQQHIWLRCSPLRTTATPSSLSSSSSSLVDEPLWRVRFGLTEQGMDRLGDVTKLTSLEKINSRVQQGQDLLQVHWEGYQWSEADELYHTVWETVEGIETLQSPVTGKLLSVVNNNDKSNKENENSNDAVIIDEDITWAELECEHNDVINAAAGWMDESSYQRWVKTLAPSKFSDQEQVVAW